MGMVWKLTLTLPAEALGYYNLQFEWEQYVHSQDTKCSKVGQFRTLIRTGRAGGLWSRGAYYSFRKPK